MWFACALMADAVPYLKLCGIHAMHSTSRQLKRSQRTDTAPDAAPGAVPDAAPCSNEILVEQASILRDSFACLKG